MYLRLKSNKMKAATSYIQATSKQAQAKKARGRVESEVPQDATFTRHAFQEISSKSSCFCVCIFALDFF